MGVNVAEEKKVKVEVVCAMLLFSETAYPKGAVLEMEETHAKVAIVDKNVKLAHPAAPVTSAIMRHIDPLDKAMQMRDFEKAKDAAAAAGIKVPDPALDPATPAPAATMPEELIVPGVEPPAPLEPARGRR